MTTKKKCLTLMQPWASLLIKGIKRVDTRSWSTPHRGELFIHSSNAPQKRAYDEDYCQNNVFRHYVNTMYEKMYGKRPHFTYVKNADGNDCDYVMSWECFKSAFPLGQILGRVDVLDCVPAWNLQKIMDRSEATRKDWEREWALGDLSTDRFGWPVKVLEEFAHPIPAKGSLQLWDCSEYLKLRF